MTPRDRLLAALAAEDARSEIFGLARTLRDEGMAQIDLYLLYEEQQQRLASDDPLYDHVVDSMDCIWGGSWAKGHDLYQEELTDERLSVARRDRHDAH